MRDGRTRHPVELCVGVGVPERVWLADCVIDWVIEGVSDGLMLCDRLWDWLGDIDCVWDGEPVTLGDCVCEGDTVWEEVREPDCDLDIVCVGVFVRVWVGERELLGLCDCVIDCDWVCVWVLVWVCEGVTEIDCDCEADCVCVAE
jgi:hypothetical protein